MLLKLLEANNLTLNDIQPVYLPPSDARATFEKGAVVGDPETVTARIQEYADLGIDTFIFSGYPHLEESIRFAELVFPLLPLKTRKKLAQPYLTGPFGEIIANNYVPETTGVKNLVKETA